MLVLFASFLFSNAAEKVVVGLIQVTESILHNPLGDALEPREVSVFSSGQFLVESNRRDGFPTCLVDLLLASKAIIVGKASRPCTLAEQTLLVHGGIKFHLVSSRDFHAYSSFAHSTDCFHSSGVILVQTYAKSFFSCSKVQSSMYPLPSVSRLQFPHVIVSTNLKIVMPSIHYALSARSADH